MDAYVELGAEVLAEPSPIAGAGETARGARPGDELLVEGSELHKGVVGELRFAVFVEGATPASAGAGDSVGDVFGECLDVRWGGDGGWHEPEAALLAWVLHPDTVGDHGVDMQEAPEVAGVV